MSNTQMRGTIGEAGLESSLSKQAQSAYKLLKQNPSKLSDQELLLTRDYIGVAKEIGIEKLDSKKIFAE